MMNIFKKTKELEKSKLDFEPEVLDHLNAIVKLDINCNIVYFNEVFEKQFGYNVQDFKGTFFDTVLKDYPPNIRRHFEKAILGKTHKFNTIGFSKIGKPIDIQITLVPIKDKNSKYVYAILKNITDFQKDTQQLNQFIKLREAFDEVDYICNFYYDVVNDLHYFSKQFAKMLGINPQSNFTPSLKAIFRYVHPDDRERLENTIKNSIKEKVGMQIEYRIIRKDQTVLYVIEQSGVLLDKKGNVEGFAGFIQDITDHKIKDDICEKGNQLKLLYDNPDVGVWSIDFNKGMYGETSKGIENITGYTNEDFKSLSWNAVVHNEDLQRYLENQHILAAGKILKHQYRIIHKDGSIRWIQDYTIPTLDPSGNIIRLDGLISDITEQKLLEERATFLASYDLLTKLPNRHKFIEKLNQLLDKYTNSNNKFAVIKLDIDGFKYVNDTLGNEIGDELLKLIPTRISEHLTPDDFIARRGGDEFMILIDHIESIDGLKRKVKQITDCLNQPVFINDYKLYITASIGIATYPDNGITSLELLRNASLALQNAVKRGKNNYYILSHSSSIQSFKNYSIGRDLKKAVENKEMVLYFQPRVDANSNQIIAAEALIRWNHSEWGLISPHEFLTIAEENGLITEIDDWVLKEACVQIKNWKDKGLKVVPISINISASHFLKPDWPREVTKIIRNTGIHPHDIEFEITESMILSNSEMVKDTIFKIKELGIKIILDDFGKGYSSLSYLTQYPFDVIKIDKSFIRNMYYSKQDMHLIKSIIYMAKGLDLRVVAEGVETIRQLKLVQQEQCHEIQGYLFSHPVTNHEFEYLLQSKTLLPIDPKQKAKESKRKYYRLNFPHPLEADIKLVSIAGRSMDLGVSKVLVEDISIGGLRFLSNLKLPIRGDVIYQFETELLGEAVNLRGNIVWKEEINEDLVEYGIKFIITKGEQAAFTTLLNSFIILLNNSSNLPLYRKVSVDRDQYFK